MIGQTLGPYRIDRELGSGGMGKVYAATVAEQQPEYAANETRSVKPEGLVSEGSCTHLGCAPLEDFEPRPVEGWGGGFFCPCHGSTFDLAGRVSTGVPAPTNMRVPPHRFVRDDLILIGQDTGAA